MFFRPRFKTYTIGEIDIRIQAPQKSKGIFRKNNAAAVVDALPLFDIVWPSSEALCRFLQTKDIEGMRILEVGCGLALVSLYLKARGADITAMDIQPLTLDALTNNARLNRLKPLPFVNASWSEGSPDLGEFDLVVGSDVLYEPQHIASLPGFLGNHVKANGEVVIVDPDRGRNEVFRAQMSEHGFTCESFRPELIDNSGMPYRGVVNRFKHRAT